MSTLQETPYQRGYRLGAAAARARVDRDTMMPYPGRVGEWPDGYAEGWRAGYDDALRAKREGMLRLVAREVRDEWPAWTDDEEDEGGTDARAHH